MPEQNDQNQYKGSSEAVLEQYDVAVECNSMSYVDQNNVQRLIYLPKGTAKRAGDLLEAKNWDELAKFPDYSMFFFCDATEPC